MRIRSIHPEQWTDDGFLSCSFAARLLALALRNEADDNGIFEWSPLKLKVRLLPLDDLDINAILAELRTSNQIWQYEVDGKQYGMVRNFYRFQRPKCPSYRHPLPTQTLPNGYKLRGKPTNFDSPTPGLPQGYPSPTPALPHVLVSGSGIGVGIGVGIGEGEGIPRKRGSAPSVSPASSSSTPTQAPTPDDVASAWNEAAKPLGLPCVRDITAGRRRTINARLKDATWAASYTAALEAIAAAPFLLGQTPRGTWRADFDWFLRPDSVTRILEGKYADAKPAVPPGICAGPDLDDYDPFPDGNAKNGGSEA